MHLFDKLKFHYQRIKFRARNAEFRRQYPEVHLPPAYMLFEAFQLNYRAYYEGGLKTAIGLLEKLSRHRELKGISILDWGCGPARILRHLPVILDNSCEIHGTDYNSETIRWCREHIDRVTFSQNQLHPPTVYEDSYFDALYGISIFTHLSEENHRKWYAELIRITKRGGVLLLTTHGKIYRQMLTNPEREQYDQGNLVVRGKVVEGHRVYAAFQPPEYARNLFESKAEILEYIEGTVKSWGLEQDIWIMRKK